MDGAVFAITLFLVFAALMLGLTLMVKGKKSVYLAAVTATLCGWFAGLLLDANIDFGGTDGFLSFRVLLPILAMGLCILRTVMKDKPD